MPPGNWAAGLPCYLESDTRQETKLEAWRRKTMAETEAEKKRVIVTGATGLIGKALCKRLRERGYAVTVFSRNPDKARKKVPGAAEYVAWEPGSPGSWASAIDGSYAVINLA